MISLRKSAKSVKRIALLLLLSFVIQIVTPTISFALTSGPTQPEFTSFEPVSTNNMVDLFTGDFTYNIPVLTVPGPNGSSYPISLSYHSGTTMEQEASWVGYGWTLNAGAITRNKRGFPDDWKGKKVKYHNKTIPNMTVSTGISAGNPEIFSTGVSLNINASIRKNNYTGLGYSVGVNVGLIDGVTTLGYGISDGTGSFSLRVNPAGILGSKVTKIAKKTLNKKIIKASKDRDRDAMKKFTSRKNQMKGSGSELKKYVSGSDVLTFGRQQMASSFRKYTGMFGRISVGVEIDPNFPLGLEAASFSASFSWQKTKEESTYDSYGFLYSDLATSDAQMDFYVDKEVNYDKKNKYIGSPVSNKDVYSISGEGMGGGFSAVNNDVVHFRPTEEVSHSQNGGIDLDVHTTGEAGVGWAGDGGYHRLTHQPWISTTNDGFEPYFRLNGDFGGYYTFDDEEVPEKYSLTQTNGVPGTKSYLPNPSTYTDDFEGDDGRSFFIGHNTFGSITAVNGGVNYNAYDKSFGDYDVDYTSIELADQLAEFSVAKDNGAVYNYGLPVFSRNEKVLSMSVLPGTTMSNGFIVEQDVYDANNNLKEELLNTIVGHEADEAYATQYLLTSIFSPDYIDLTNDGPTEDDFGGWTKFEYVQKYGSDDKNDQSADWYQWRMPYSGFNLQKNSFTNRNDDLASYTEGQKEIYYLDVIRTKTHVAKFVLKNRADSYEADEPKEADGGAAIGDDGLMALDKILLFTIEEYKKYEINQSNGVPLQVVHFRHDYSLCEGVPNNDGTQTYDGKLTLKKMWVDYEGIYEAKLSPYEFYYEYPDVSLYPAKYKSGIDDVRQMVDAIQNPTPAQDLENPDYDIHGLDAWGYYQKNGSARHADFRPWLDQTMVEGDFDPAAWQLKRIKLPSGGEIHVQYEQDQYRYVQDEEACAMASLDDSYFNADGANDSWFIIHPEELGEDPSVVSSNAYLNFLNNYFHNRKIYFKFFYSLLDDDNTEPDIDECAGEYIDGYATVVSVEPDALSGGVKITIEGDNAHDTPKELCLDFWKHNRRGVPISSLCLGTSYVAEEPTHEDIMAEVQGLINSSMPVPGNVCTVLSPQYSYLKIPVYKGKRGGGLRVKRLMMFTEADELNGVPELYGTEYIYEDNKGFSYGVATNEPESIREENGLVQFLADKTLSSWDEFKEKLVGGRDLDQYEGPLGEGYLPGPSVGYSFVITKNIHSGKTNTGFSINEFYTAKDFPFKSMFTSIEAGKDYLPLPLPYYSSFTNNAWLTQGYVYKTYNMHGKPRKSASYGGSYHYDANDNDVIDPTDPAEFNQGLYRADLRTLISSTENVYFAPDDEIPVMTSLGTIVNRPIGRETELIDYNKRLHDKSYTLSLDFDAEVGYPFLLFASVFPQVTVTEADLYNHVSVKVVNYPAMQKSTKTFVDGVYSTSENIAFDPKNGRPLITKSYDAYNDFSVSAPNTIQLNNVSHNGVYLSQNIPGWLYYENMDQKAKGEGKFFELGSTNDATGNIASNVLTLSPTTAPPGPGFCDLMGSLSTGDLIRVKMDGSSNYYFYHLAEIEGVELTLQQTYYNGSTVTGEVDNFKIIRSGSTNQTSMDVGAFTTYGVQTPNYTSTSASPTSGQTSFLSGIQTAAENDSYVSDGSGQVIYAAVTDCDNAFEYTASFQYNSQEDQLSMDFSIPGIYYGSEETYVCSQTLIGDPDVYEFFADYTTGEIFYGDPNGCFAQKVDCFTFCDQSAESLTVDEVVASSALTLSDRWDYDETPYDNESAVDFSSYTFNDFELGKRGKWRVENVYQYKESVVKGMNSTPFDYTTELNNSDRAAYNAGTYTLEVFNYRNPEFSSEKWLRVSHVTRYSPNGNALEEENILGIRSTAKYGYDKTLPYLVANNAGYEKALFEGFEKTYNTGQYLEDGLALESGVTLVSDAHSGETGAQRTSSGAVLTTQQVTIDQQLVNNGMHFRMWVKGADYPQDFNVSISGGATATFSQVAQLGEWELIETLYDCSTLLNQDVEFIISYSGSGTVVVDDIRMQPRDAEMAAYVYDTDNLRLVASFDDQHFATFFQYNLKGQLVRKLIETEKGVRTLTEQQYNTPKQNRSAVLAP